MAPNDFLWGSLFWSLGLSFSDSRGLNQGVSEPTSCLLSLVLVLNTPAPIILFF